MANDASPPSAEGAGQLAVPARELEQPALADAGRALDQRHPPLARQRLGEQRVQRAHLALALDEVGFVCRGAGRHAGRMLVGG